MNRADTGRRRVLAVIGPGEGATSESLTAAFRLGELAAGLGWMVLTGGRCAGVMDAAARGARAAGGIAIGVLPSADARDASPALDIAIVTGIGEMRNQAVVLSSDAVVMCGMNAGTAVEAALAVKYRKPLILLASDPTVRAFFRSLDGDRVRLAETPEEAIACLPQSS